MSREQDRGRNPLGRLSRGGIPDGAIVPLKPEQRKAYPHVIYELESDSPFDLVLVQASYDAMAFRAADFPIKIDVVGKNLDHKVVIRTSADKERERVVQSALFLGLTEATRRKVKELNRSERPDLSDYHKTPQYVAGKLLWDFVSNPELFESFRKYYGGLRWGTDQEKFTRVLFVHGTDFDPDFLDKNLTGGHVSNLVYSLGVDIPYDQQRDWYSAAPVEIFARFPELDYRRLQDEEFRATPEGQKLLKEYTELCGDIVANQNKRGLERNITRDGRELPRPQIPLSRHPIIEALVVDELSIDRPKPKYDFGPSDLTDLVLDSDSQPAHESLVTAINSRLPEGHRRVFDGPDEFEHKHRNIWSILRAYKEAYGDDQRRDLLRRDLARIMNAFTGDGEIATSVREENVAWREKSRSWGSDKDSTEVYEVKDIVRDLIKIGVTAPDPEIVARAEDLIALYVPENGNELTRPDALALSRADLMLVLIDALKEVSIGTQPGVFERTGTRVFRDSAIGEQLRGFVETRIEAIKMRSTPEVFLAAAGLRKFDLLLGDKKSPEEVEARRHFDQLVRPANQLIEAQRQAKNQLLLRLLGQLAGSGTLGQSSEAVGLFAGFVKRVEFSDYHMRELPAEYQTLMELVNNPGLTERQRNDILWQMQNQFEYVESEAAHLLVPVILDMYQVALGPVDAVRLPTRDTAHGLAAATHIVRNHGHEMFKSASQEQLETLANYGRAIRAHAVSIATGAMLTNGEIDADRADLLAWQKESLINLRNAMRELQSIKEHYEKYLRAEAVKVYPHVYYPWLLEQFVPFWQKMQWEVEPGNEPSHDINELYRVLEDHVQNKLVFRKPEEYTEDFDTLEEGHVDSLLKECYERMVVPHDIKYNTTVWQNGLSFMHAAVAYMPPVLLERIKAKYPNTPFVEYLEKEHERRNKEEDIH